MTRCFWVEPTGTGRRYLRRYENTRRLATIPKCPGRYGYHNAQAFLYIVSGFTDPEGYIKWCDSKHYKGHTSWPRKCEHCDYIFHAEDEWQVRDEALYVGADGREYSTDEHIPGMMWDAFWWPKKGPDGRAVMVICPDGTDWMIDGRANNCKLPDDTVHRCWCRHGVPPGITVNKSPEPGWTTCDAGGGSIQTSAYHGMLENGVFRPC